MVLLLAALTSAEKRRAVCLRALLLLMVLFMEGSLAQQRWRGRCMAASAAAAW
jgi:hypothetical protein